MERGVEAIKLEIRRLAEEEARKILEEGEREIEELKIKATNNLESAISAGIALVRGS